MAMKAKHKAMLSHVAKSKNIRRTKGRRGSTMIKTTNKHLMKKHQEELKRIAEKHDLDQSHVEAVEAEAKAHAKQVEQKMLHAKRTRDGETRTDTTGTPASAAASAPSASALAEIAAAKAKHKVLMFVFRFSKTSGHFQPGALLCSLCQHPYLIN